MNQEMIRENAIDRIRNEHGLIDVIQWFPRSFLQGYTDALVRIIPYPCAVYIRVFDGGFLEEITFEDATKLKA
jgi:hypothetical protein